MSEDSREEKGKKDYKKSEPEWKPDKSQILTIKESLGKKKEEKS